MTRHLLKLMWNQKRANALVILEIFAAFLVVFAVATTGLTLLGSYRRPLGFSIEDVWTVGLDMKLQGDDSWSAETAQRLETLVREVEALPAVQATAAVKYPPYGFGATNDTRDYNGRRVELLFNQVTDGAAEVLGLEVVEGRWFNASDDVAHDPPVVLDLEAARAVFRDQPAVGKILVRGQRESKVVGVISDFRKGGELELPTNYVFERQRLGNVDERPPNHLLLKLEPGTPATFEETLYRRLQALAPGWSFDVGRLSDARDLALRLHLVPLLAGGLVAAFLLLMVVLGLTGVLWQNVTRRTQEIGLRRAVGASGASIQRQVLAEIAVIGTLGMALGLVVVLQIPLLGLFDVVSAGTFLGGLGLSLLFLYLLTTACGLYPSLLASRVQPAEALHDE